MKRLTDITPEQFAKAAELRATITNAEIELNRIFASPNGSNKKKPGEKTSAPALTRTPLQRKPKTVVRNWSPEARDKASRKMKRRWAAIKKAMKAGTPAPATATT